MAARKKTAALPSTVKKIKTTLLINALHNHVLGKKELSASQVAAAGILIRKVIPDLAAVHVEADVDHHVEIKWRS